MTSDDPPPTGPQPQGDPRRPSASSSLPAQVRRIQRRGRRAGRNPGERRRRPRKGDFPASQLHSLGCFAPILVYLCLMVIGWVAILLEGLLGLDRGTLLTDGLGEVLGGIAFNLFLWAWPFTYLLYYAVFMPLARLAWRRRAARQPPVEDQP